MRKTLAFILLVAALPASAFFAKIENVDSKTYHNMKGKSWTDNCPINIQDLHHLRLNYIDYEGKKQIGELLVHKTISEDVITIFKELYEAKYPIQSMRLYSDFDGKNSLEEANNTTSFYCKPKAGKRKISKHAFGLAIDINPMQNPYKGKHLWPQGAKKNLERDSTTPGLITTQTKIFEIFTKHGWKWGGLNKHSDYMHFEKAYGKHYAVDSMSFLNERQKIKGLSKTSEH